MGQWKELKEENQKLTDKLTALLSPNTIKKIEHSADFWTNISMNILKNTGPFGTDSIKTMIKTGKMTVYDTHQNLWDATLLFIAASNGAYDLAQFLINNGADIDA